MTQLFITVSAALIFGMIGLFGSDKDSGTIIMTWMVIASILLMIGYAINGDKIFH